MPIARPLVLSIATLMLLVACDRPAESPQGYNPDDDEQEATAAAGGAAAQEGEGTLRLDDVTYPFHVRACDVSGEVDDLYQTISGRGTTPEGESFDVFVSRSDAGGVLMHTVSFQLGDVRSPDAMVLEAQRMYQAGRWTDLHGGAAEPLVQIDGNRVVAEGLFVPAEDPFESEPISGRLEATCTR